MSTARRLPGILSGSIAAKIIDEAITKTTAYQYAKASDSLPGPFSVVEDEPLMPNCPVCGEFGVVQEWPTSTSTHYCGACREYFGSPEAVASTEPQMFRSMRATFAECLETSLRKSHDYAKGDNPYRNFEGSPRIGVPVVKGLLIRIQDKMIRLENLIDTPGKVKDESVDDTIADAINYLAILKARREYERSL